SAAVTLARAAKSAGTGYRSVMASPWERAGPVCRMYPAPAPGPETKTPALGRRPRVTRVQLGSGVLAPLAQRGQAVLAGAGVDGLLRLGDVAAHVLGPDLQRGGLHGAAVAEAQRPGLLAHAVHRVQVRGGVLVGLAAGQEHDARQGGRHRGLQAVQGRGGDLLD